MELRSESEELTSLDETPLSSGGLLSSEMLCLCFVGEEGMTSFAFSVEEWMETWSAGKAVLHGIGLEITRDFLFFDLLEVLIKKSMTNILIVF